MSTKVTAHQLITAVFALIVLFGPPVALVVFPENEVIQLLFGGYRLLVFYILAIGCFAVYERRSLRRWAGIEQNGTQDDKS